MSNPSQPPRARLDAGTRRAQILDSSREVFLRSGLAGTRVRELSRAAGVNEALLYRHFESKEALFEAAVAEPLAAAVQRLINLGGLEGTGDLHSAEGRRENLERIFLEMIDRLVDLGPMLGVMLFGEPERGPVFYCEQLMPALDRLAAATEAAVGEAGPPGYDARLAVMTAFSTCLMLSLDNHFGGEMLDDRRGVAERLTRNVLLGFEAR